MWQVDGSLVLNLADAVTKLAISMFINISINWTLPPAVST